MSGDPLGLLPVKSTLPISWGCLFNLPRHQDSCRTRSVYAIADDSTSRSGQGAEGWDDCRSVKCQDGDVFPCLHSTIHLNSQFNSIHHSIHHSTHHSIQLSSTCVLPQFIVLGTTCIILNTAVDLLAVVAANRFVASGTARAARERLLSRISGGTMLSLGMRVAIAKREN